MYAVLGNLARYSILAILFILFILFILLILVNSIGGENPAFEWNKPLHETDIERGVEHARQCVWSHARVSDSLRARDRVAGACARA